MPALKKEAAITEIKQIGLPAIVDAMKSEYPAMTKVQLADLVRSTFKIIGDKLVAKMPVAIPDFGKFDIKHRPERLCHNPQDPTKKVTAPAHDVIVFRPSSGLKSEVK